MHVRKLIWETRSSCDHLPDFPGYLRVKQPSSGHPTSRAGRCSSQRLGNFCGDNLALWSTSQSPQEDGIVQFRGDSAVLGLAHIPAMKLENKTQQTVDTNTKGQHTSTVRGDPLMSDMVATFIHTQIRRTKGVPLRQRSMVASIFPMSLQMSRLQNKIE